MDKFWFFLMIVSWPLAVISSGLTVMQIIMIVNYEGSSEQMYNRRLQVKIKWPYFKWTIGTSLITIALLAAYYFG